MVKQGEGQAGDAARQPAPAGRDRRALFLRARERLTGSLAGSVALWIEPLEQLLAGEAEGSFDPGKRAEFSELSGRFRASQSQMAARLEARLLRASDQALTSLDQWSADLANSGEPLSASLIDILTRSRSLQDEGAVQRAALAEAIRQHGGAAYEAWLARNATLLDHLGTVPELDDMHPLGAPVLAEAMQAAILSALNESPEQQSRVWELIRPWLLGPAQAHVTAALADANAVLIQAGILRSLSPPAQVAVQPVADAEVVTQTAAIQSPPTQIAPTQSPPTQSPPSSPPAADSAPTTETNASSAGSAGQAPRQAAERAQLLPVNALRGDAQQPAIARSAGLASVRAMESDAVAFAHRVAELPYSRQARQKYFSEIRAAVADAPGLPAAAAVVDVVGALFEYAVDDERLPDSAKPLLWRLQQPVVLLALLDSRYLAEGQRSVRDLVENLAAIATGFSDQMVPGRELFQRIETAVRAVEIVSTMLHSRSQVLSEQVGKHFQATALQVATIATRVANERKELESTPRLRNRRRNRARPNKDAEQSATERVQQVLEDKLSLYSVPDSVGEFLRKIWLRHLRTALLRDGELSGGYNTALRVVDDLLWSADLEAPRQSRRQLTSRIPPLISTLMGGIKETGAQETDYRAFFDELYLTHLRKLQRNGDAASGSTTLGNSTAPAPQQDVPVLTQEVAKPLTPDQTEQDLDAMARTARRLMQAHDERAQTPAPSVTVAPEVVAKGSQQLLEILANVDLNDANRKRSRVGGPPEVQLASIETGMWVELEESSGKTAVAKVAWINSRRTVFLLLRNPDRRPLSMNAEYLLERLRKQTAYLLG